MERARGSFPSRPRIPESGHRAIGLPSPSKRLFATHLVPAPPQSFFSREPHPFEESPQGGLAEAHASDSLQKAAPLFDGGGGSGAYVFFEQPLCAFVGFWGPTTPLLWSKRPSLGGELGVALD